MSQTEYTILLVDDDPDDVGLLRQAFEDMGGGLTITEAHDGVEALRQLGALHTLSNLPCLIVLDINMPRMDGKETLVALQANLAFRKIPVVILSTSSGTMDKLFFSKKGVEFITKPLTLEALHAVASKLLAYCKAQV